jgi:hypothetical protein
MTLAAQVAQEEEREQDDGQHQQNISFEHMEKMHDERRDSRGNPGNGIPIKPQESFHLVPKVLP